MEPTILIIDDDATTVALHLSLEEAGLSVAATSDSGTAIEMLRANDYAAIVLDPMIRHPLNGYAVLDYLEQERPGALPHVFLYSGMSRQTVARTAPCLVSRLYRKPAGLHELSAAVIRAAAPAESSAPGDSAGSVLLVEDDPVAARVTAAWLRRLGYSCHWLPNGQKVLDTAFTATFDVIMLDLAMPGVDGFAVLGQLRSKTPQLLDRVIVTTGMPDKYLADPTLQRIRGILQKPLDVALLRNLLGEPLESQMPYAE